MNTAILFDLDGTLLDTLEDLLDASNYALNHFGFPSCTLAQLRRYVGNGAENQIRLCLGAQATRENIDKVLPFYKAYYTAHCQNKTRPYAGIPEVLAALQQKYPIAIVSNKPDSAVKALCADYFPGIYALGESEDCPRKPAPDMVYKAMKALEAQRCIYVGDSEVDLLTAKNAGVPCISVLWGFRDKEDMPDGEHFCQDPREMINMIEELTHVQ